MEDPPDDKPHKLNEDDYKQFMNELEKDDLLQNQSTNDTYGMSKDDDASDEEMTGNQGAKTLDPMQNDHLQLDELVPIDPEAKKTENQLQNSVDGDVGMEEENKESEKSKPISQSSKRHSKSFIFYIIFRTEFKVKWYGVTNLQNSIPYHWAIKEFLDDYIVVHSEKMQVNIKEYTTTDISQLDMQSLLQNVEFCNGKSIILFDLKNLEHFGIAQLHKIFKRNNLYLVDIISDEKYIRQQIQAHLNINILNYQLSNKEIISHLKLWVQYSLNEVLVNNDESVHSIINEAVNLACDLSGGNPFLHLLDTNLSPEQMKAKRQEIIQILQSDSFLLIQETYRIMHKWIRLVGLCPLIIEADHIQYNRIIQELYHKLVQKWDPKSLHTEDQECILSILIKVLNAAKTQPGDKVLIIVSDIEEGRILQAGFMKFQHKLEIKFIPKKELIKSKKIIDVDGTEIYELEDFDILINLSLDFYKMRALVQSLGNHLPCSLNFKESKSKHFHITLDESFSDQLFRIKPKKHKNQGLLSNPQIEQCFGQQYFLIKELFEYIGQAWFLRNIKEKYEEPIIQQVKVLGNLSLHKIIMTTKFKSAIHHRNIQSQKAYESKLESLSNILNQLSFSLQSLSLVNFNEGTLNKDYLNTLFSLYQSLQNCSLYVTQDSTYSIDEDQIGIIFPNFGQIVEIKQSFQNRDQKVILVPKQELLYLSDIFPTYSQLLKAIIFYSKQHVFFTHENDQKFLELIQEQNLLDFSKDNQLPQQESQSDWISLFKQINRATIPILKERVNYLLIHQIVQYWQLQFQIFINRDRNLFKPLALDDIDVFYQEQQPWQSKVYSSDFRKEKVIIIKKCSQKERYNNRLMPAKIQLIDTELQAVSGLRTIDELYMQDYLIELSPDATIIEYLRINKPDQLISQCTFKSLDNHLTGQPNIYQAPSAFLRETPLTLIQYLWQVISLDIVKKLIEALSLSQTVDQEQFLQIQQMLMVPLIITNQNRKNQVRSMLSIYQKTQDQEMLVAKKSNRDVKKRNMALFRDLF